MTKFTGPLSVGPWESETTAATIDASGTATFAALNVVGGVVVSGNQTFGEDLAVSGDTTLTGTLAVTGAITASVDSTFREEITVSGTANFKTGVVASGTSVFEFSPRSQQGAKGVFVAEATLVGANTAGAPVDFNLPSGAHVIDFSVNVEMPFETGAGVTAANITLSAKNVANGRLAEVNVSGSGMFHLDATDTGHANAFRNIAATLQAHVSIQGSNTALASGQAMLSILYVV